MIKIIRNLTVNICFCVQTEFTQSYCITQTHSRLINQRITPTSTCCETWIMCQNIFWVCSKRCDMSCFSPQCMYHTTKSLQNSQLFRKSSPCATEERTHSFVPQPLTPKPLVFKARYKNYLAWILCTYI